MIAAKLIKNKKSIVLNQNNESSWYFKFVSSDNEVQRLFDDIIPMIKRIQGGQAIQTSFEKLGPEDVDACLSYAAKTLDRAFIKSSLDENQVVTESLMGEYTPHDMRDLFAGVRLGQVSDIVDILKVRKVDFLLDGELESLFPEPVGDSLKETIVRFFSSGTAHDEESIGGVTVLQRLSSLIRSMKCKIYNTLNDSKKSDGLEGVRLLSLVDTDPKFQQVLREHGNSSMQELGVECTDRKSVV